MESGQKTDIGVQKTAALKRMFRQAFNELVAYGGHVEGEPDLTGLDGCFSRLVSMEDAQPFLTKTMVIKILDLFKEGWTVDLSLAGLSMTRRGRELLNQTHAIEKLICGAAGMSALVQDSCSNALWAITETPEGVELFDKPLFDLLTAAHIRAYEGDPTTHNALTSIIRFSNVPSLVDENTVHLFDNLWKYASQKLFIELVAASKDGGNNRVLSEDAHKSINHRVSSLNPDQFSSVMKEADDILKSLSRPLSSPKNVRQIGTTVPSG